MDHAARILMQLRMKQTLTREDIQLLQSIGIGIDGDISDEDDSLPPEFVEKFLNKEYLMKTHEEVATRMGQAKYSSAMSVNYNSTVGMHNKSPVILNPKNKIDITTLSKSVNKAMVGKFLLCRVICPPVTLTATVTVVDEPKGTKALRFALYDYPKNKRPEDFLPVGTILAIKNPWFKTTADGGLAIRVDQSANMIKVHPEQLSKLFPTGLKWECEIPKKYRPLCPEGQEGKPTSALDLKGLGNKCFGAKRYDDAIDYYSRGLHLTPGNIDLLSNRAAAFINIRCYNKALSDVNKVLDIEPFHVKGIFRRVKALWGLLKYYEADEFLEKKLLTNVDLKKNLDLSNLLLQSKVVIKQSETGKNYDMLKLISNDQSHDVGEFKGPVKVTRIKGRGRGLVTTENVSCGQVLLCSKAFAIYFRQKEEVQNVKIQIDWGSGCVRSDMHTKLVDLIHHKLETEPEQMKEFLDLHCEISTKVASTTGEVSKEIIDSIVAMNNYGGSRMKALTSDEVKGHAVKVLTDSDASSAGIWILPSYINDGCVDSNANWNVLGDVMFVRAIKDIKKGTEILMPYKSCLLPFEDRERMQKVRNYHCECRLCVIDRGEPERIHLMRKKLLKSIDFQLGNKKKDALYKLMSRIDELESLREENPELNLSMLHPLMSLATKIVETTNNFQKAAQEVEKAYRIIDETPARKHAVIICCELISLYIHANKKKFVLKWVEILRKELILAYGSEHVLKNIGEDLLPMLQFFGVSFF